MAPFREADESAGTHPLPRTAQLNSKEDQAPLSKRIIVVPAGVV
jgi:hypothetical protein